MSKKYYLTFQEQKLWNYIKNKPIIKNQLIKNIFPEFNQNKRNKLLHSLYKKQFLKKARKDLYFNPENLDNYYSLALEIHGGYIGLSSALKHYNLLDYEDFTIFIITKNYQKKIPLKDTEYTLSFIPLKNLFTGFQNIGQLYISTLEKTIFDSLLKSNLIGYPVITKAIYDSKPDWDKLIKYFKQAKNRALCQRTGYVLEMMQNKTKTKIPKHFMDYLLNQVKYPTKLSPIKIKTTYDPKWKVQDNLGEKNIMPWRQ